MDRRTFEGPMEWEYQNKGPFDPTSPFTQAAQVGGLQNGFASPSRQSASSRPNPFATPSRSQQARPLFTPQQTSSKPSAPPFRNPAFTTPRKPFDEIVLSEASGAEESPAQTEASDFPNDTPEADRMSDVNMSGTITPAKIDKAFRYHKGACSARKHVSGKGEIRPHRDVGPTELTRRRKRSERSNYAWRQSQDSDDDSDDSFSTRSRHRPRHRNNRKPQPHGGVVASVLRMMEENHTAPENLHRWIQLGINIFLGLIFCGVVASIVRAVHSDIAAVNEAARQDIRAKAARCRNDYIVNHCATTDAPAIKELCNKWFDCMSHNPDSIVRVRATMTEIANIMNDFFGHLNLKAWGASMAILIVIVFANNAMVGRSSNTTPTHTHPPHPPNQVPGSQAPHPSSEFMWIPVQTPNMPRHSLLNDETDTDNTPPRPQQLPPPFTPSGRRSPSKRERSLSPEKYSQSPRKRY